MHFKPRRYTSQPGKHPVVPRLLAQASIQWILAMYISVIIIIIIIVVNLWKKRFFYFLPPPRRICCLFVCLSVCLSVSNFSERIWMKFLAKIDNGPMNK